MVYFIDHIHVYLLLSVPDHMLIESRQRVFSIHAGMKKSVVEVWNTARQVEGSGDRSPARGDTYLSTPVTVCESERPLFSVVHAYQSRDTAPLSPVS
jgi:hypothetical protein